MDLDINLLRRLNSLENIEITMHAAKRLEQRGISVDDIMYCIEYGEIIEWYPTDYPFPSCLVLGSVAREKFLHVVVGSDGEKLWLVTAYYPDIEKWEADMKTRKEK